MSQPETPKPGSQQQVVRERFPIQATDSYYGRNVTIPWNYAEEAYKEYSVQYGTSQSLQRLAERHGFGVEEIVMLLVQRIKRLEAKLPNDKAEARRQKPTEQP